MRGFVVVDGRGRIESGTLGISASHAKELFMETFDAAEHYSNWGYWEAKGYAAVRCEVFAAANHKRRRAPRS